MCSPQVLRNQDVNGEPLRIVDGGDEELEHIEYVTENLHSVQR